jgi:hypothetical protein
MVVQAQRFGLAPQRRQCRPFAGDYQHHSRPLAAREVDHFEQEADVLLEGGAADEERYLALRAMPQAWRKRMPLPAGTGFPAGRWELPAEELRYRIRARWLPSAVRAPPPRPGRCTDGEPVRARRSAGRPSAGSGCSGTSTLRNACGRSRCRECCALGQTHSRIVGGERGLHMDQVESGLGEAAIEVGERGPAHQPVFGVQRHGPGRHAKGVGLVSVADALDPG